MWIWFTQWCFCVWWFIYRLVGDSIELLYILQDQDYCFFEFLDANDTGPLPLIPSIGPWLDLLQHVGFVFYFVFLSFDSICYSMQGFCVLSLLCDFRCSLWDFCVLSLLCHFFVFPTCTCTRLHTYRHTHTRTRTHTHARTPIFFFQLSQMCWSERCERLDVLFHPNVCHKMYRSYRVMHSVI